MVQIIEHHTEKVIREQITVELDNKTVVIINYLSDDGETLKHHVYDNETGEHVVLTVKEQQQIDDQLVY